VKEQTTREESSSINPYEALESWARANVQDFIQRLLEEEIEEFIGRAKSERHVDRNDAFIGMAMGRHGTSG
jgi:transposase-like protein